MIRYRRDIDGLRALAVVPVVLFHIGFTAFHGGFVGVDIFFVISGYLIGRTINEEIKDGRFSIVDFYNRRFRRIMPALFVMLAFVWLAAAIGFFPDDAQQTGRSLLAATWSGSNILFWREINYFTTGESEPLLHTWSLGVEEQFYLLFPLFMMATYALSRLTRRDLLLPVTLAAAAVSFLFCVWATQKMGAFAFYMLPPRGWELLLGFLVALVPADRLTHRAWRETAALVGMLLILGAMVLIDQRTPFPGYAALAPCAGAALLIAAGAKGQTQIGRLLEFKPFVWIGLISYSLYLWHWPLIVIPRDMFDVALDTNTKKLLTALAAVPVAWLSWRFVEQPFRRRSVSKRTIFISTGIGAVLLTVMGGVLAVTHGLPGRFPPAIVRMSRYHEDRSVIVREGVCSITPGYKFEQFSPSECLPKVDAPPSLILIGDSHAAHLWWGLQAAAGYRVPLASAGGCIPLLSEAAESFSPECQKLRHYLREDYLPKRRGDTVLLGGRWSEHLLPPLEQALNWAQAHGINIILAGQAPAYAFPLPQLLARGQVRGDAAYAERRLLPDIAQMDDALRDIARRHHVPFVSSFQLVCHAGHCRTLLDDGTPMERDTSHFTAKGSIWVMRQLWPQIAADVARPRFHP